MLSRGGETEEGRKEERCLPFAVSGPFVIPPGDPITFMVLLAAYGCWLKGNATVWRIYLFHKCMGARTFGVTFTRLLIHVWIERESN